VNLSRNASLIIAWLLAIFYGDVMGDVLAVEI